MSRTTSIKTAVLASRGNQTIYAAGAPGTALYAAPSSDNADDGQILVPPGVWVVADANTTSSLGYSLDATASKVAFPNIKVGLAIDLNKDGISDVIRWVVDGSSGCSILEQEAEKAVCGVSSIVDVFPRCIECGQTYTIQVRAYRADLDPYAKSRGMGNVYDFSYTVPCGGCDQGDCPPTVNADVLMCGMANVIDGINVDPNWDIRLNGYPFEVPKHNWPFKMAQLYDTGLTTYEYCFSEIDGECANCNLFNDIGGFSSDAGTLDETFAPVTWIEEGGVKYSKKAHLERAANLITVALDGKGKAVYLPAVGNCCSNHKIEVNTCLTDFVLKDGDGVTITPCGEGNVATNPYAAITVYGECKGCGDTNDTWTPTIGWRFYAIPLPSKCDCIAGNFTMQDYTAEIEVFPKYGFADGGVHVVQRQKFTLPTGQGFQVQALEMEYLDEYAGEFFVEDNFEGRYGTPAENDRLNHITAQCDKSYCVITQKLAQIQKREIGGKIWAPAVTAHFAVPTGDATTITSLVGFLNAYYAGEECGVPSVSCA